MALAVQRIAAPVLERALVRVLTARGVCAEHAGWVATSLVGTSLRGVDTHGIALLPTYVRELDGGRGDEITEEPTLAPAR